MVLASADTSLDLSKLADMADKVMEVVTPTVASISTQQTNSKVTLLHEEVARLADLITSVTNDRSITIVNHQFHCDISVEVTLEKKGVKRNVKDKIKYFFETRCGCGSYRNCPCSRAFLIDHYKSIRS